MNRKIRETDVEALLNKYRLTNSENELRRIPMEREMNLLKNIRDGRFREIVIRDFSAFSDGMGITAQNPKRNFEYYTVSGIVLFCRAAIDGGVKPDDAYDLSDVMLQELEQTKTIQEVHDIFELAAVLFAKLVYNSRREKKSYQIEQCRIYISRNIYKKISVKDLSEYVGLNPNYLSRLFSQTEKITLHDYIQREKITVACNLLKYSDRTISEIAQYMGFQSQSNFALVFKKWASMTPTEYRNLNYHDIYSE